MYFDGCYFDGTYFEASVCTPTTTGGRQAFRAARQRQSQMTLEPEPLLDDEEAILVLEGL